MKKKTKTQKIMSIVSIILGALVVAWFVASAILEAVLPGTAYAEWMKGVWDVTKLPEAWNAHYPVILHSLVLIVVVFAVSKILRTIFAKIMEKSNRAKTVITLLDGIIKYGCAIVLIFLILDACGVETKAIWESVGILTLIIGLGAQSLIADIIAGIFIIFENEYNVGEIVSIDDFRGTVSEIGIRATKILDMAGNIKIINNSDIKNVVNLSRELSLAVVDCEFPYDVPVEFVEKILKDAFPEFKEKIPAIIEGPFYKGVSAYEASNVAVKIVAKCSEEDRYQVQRDMMREYRQLFIAHGIDLSFDQVVINQPSKTEIKVTKKIKEEAAQFVEEQKEASEGMEQNTTANV